MRSHSLRNSTMTSGEAIPCMSLIQLISVNASHTVFLLAILFGTMLKISGEIYSIRWPKIHLSLQNRVLVPSPTSVATAIEQSALTPSVVCNGKLAHGLLGADFLSQSQWTRRARFRFLMLDCRRPPNDFGHVTLGQAIKQ